MQFGIIGSGSWATALAKILTDKGHSIHWWIRNEATIAHLQKRHHNPHYLSSVNFDVSLLHMSTDVRTVVQQADVLVIAVPSAYAEQSLSVLVPGDWQNKKIVSAIKGLLPEKNILLNYYLQQQFGVALDDYFAVLGPCHAEEVAAEKLSYLTFSGTDITTASEVAAHFQLRPQRQDLKMFR